MYKDLFLILIPEIFYDPPLSTPTLYSYGTVSVVPGQSVSLLGVTGKDIMSAASWAISFRVRVRARPAGGQLFSIGSGGDLIINHGVNTNVKVSKTYTINGVSTPDTSLVPGNDVKALFKYNKKEKEGPLIFEINSFCELEMGVWHTITLTATRKSATDDNLYIKIFTDGCLFGLPEDPNIINGDKIWDYSNSTDTSLAVLGGGVDAEFTNILFWKNAIPSDTQIIQNNYESATPAPYKQFDFTPLHNDSTLFTLNKGANLCCNDPGVLFGGGVAIPDPDDQLNPGGDLSQAFSIQTWIYSTLPVSKEESQLQVTVIGNGIASDPQAFVFGLQYNSNLDNFKLGVKFPGIQDIIFDSTSLLPRIWYNVGLMWDGSKLSFIVNGQITSSCNPQTSSAILNQTSVCIGAIESPASASGYTRFLHGYLQGLGIWNRILTNTEIANFQNLSAATIDESLAFFDLISTEFSNTISGRHLIFKGTTALSETIISNFSSSVQRNNLPLQVPAEDLVNLSQLQYYEDNPSQLPKFDDTAPIVSTTYSASEVDQLTAEIEFYLKQVPSYLQPTFRVMMHRNLRIGLQRIDSLKGPIPGCFTSAVEGEFRVFYFHTAKGPVETMRVSAATVNECDAWKINVWSAALSLVFCVIGVMFSASALVKAIAKGYEKSSFFGNAITKVFSGLHSPAGVMDMLGMIYSAALLPSIIKDCIAGCSWWNLALTVAGILLTIGGMFSTGGWYIAFIAAQIQLNFAIMTYTLGTKPRGC